MPFRLLRKGIFFYNAQLLNISEVNTLPSASVLEQKKQIVAELTEKLKGACAGVVVDYKGISVADDTKLRKTLREANIDYFVVKNSLLGFAADEAGLGDLKNVLAGTTAIALSTEDYISGAKILYEFSQQANGYFELKSGFMDGEVVSLEKITSLAKLPSREVLLATVCSVFSAPIAAFARGVQAIVDKGGVEACEPAEKAEDYKIY